MAINFSEVQFVKSVGINSKEVYFDDKNEVVFVGRSNMGKSSIMNTIFQKKDMVKTSARPGKTRLANIFKVGTKYYLTDLPGYGFAKLGKKTREDLDALISWYLEERREFITKVVMLVDAKLGAQESDIEMYKYILELELPITIVLSKCDKISRNEIPKSIAHAQENFFGQEIIPVSSKSKLGIEELKKSIKKSLTSK